MGRRFTKIQVDERVSRLEQAIMKLGWSLALADALALKEGITRGQVYRDRKSLHKRWKAEAESVTTEEHRIGWLLRLRHAGRRAAKDGHHGTAVRALTEEGRALGYFEAERVEVKVEHTGKVEHVVTHTVLHIDTDRLDVDEHRQLVALLEKAKPAELTDRGEVIDV